MLFRSHIRNNGTLPEVLVSQQENGLRLREKHGWEAVRPEGQKTWQQIWMDQYLLGREVEVDAISDGAVEQGIPCFTSLDTSAAWLHVLEVNSPSLIPLS